MVTPLFRDLALLPSCFAKDSYECAQASLLARLATAQHCGPTTTIRDLRDGEWRQMAFRLAGQNDLGWRALVEKWAKDGALKRHAPTSGTLEGDDDCAWRAEAVRTHQSVPLTGIIAGPNAGSAPESVPPTATILDLNSTPWAGATGAALSVDIDRSAEGLAGLFMGLFRQNRRCHFIDPYLDPERRSSSADYAPLGDVLVQVSSRLDGIWVCFHRSSNAPGPAGAIGDELSVDAWRRRFESRWHQKFREARVRARVCLWRDISDRHDRMLLTRRVGLLCGNGFDLATHENGAPKEMSVAALSDAIRYKHWNARDAHAHRHEDHFHGAFHFGYEE